MQHWDLKGRKNIDPCLLMYIGCYISKMSSCTETECADFNFGSAFVATSFNFIKVFACLCLTWSEIL